MSLACAIFLGVFFAIILSDVVKWTVARYVLQKELEGIEAVYRKDVKKMSEPVDYKPLQRSNRKTVCRTIREPVPARSMRECQNQLGETISDLHIRCTQGYFVDSEKCD